VPVRARQEEAFNLLRRDPPLPPDKVCPKMSRGDPAAYRLLANPEKRSRLPDRQQGLWASSSSWRGSHFFCSSWLSVGTWMPLDAGHTERSANAFRAASRASRRTMSISFERTVGSAAVASPRTSTLESCAFAGAACRARSGRALLFTARFLGPRGDAYMNGRVAILCPIVQSRWHLRRY
jgi:hypothetical protein